MNKIFHPTFEFFRRPISQPEMTLKEHNKFLRWEYSSVCLSCQNLHHENKKLNYVELSFMKTTTNLMLEPLK